jgi:hypothetical protein
VVKPKKLVKHVSKLANDLDHLANQPPSILAAEVAVLLSYGFKRRQIVRVISSRRAGR